MTVGSYILQALKSQYKSQNTDSDIFPLLLTAGIHNWKASTSIQALQTLKNLQLSILKLFHPKYENFCYTDGEHKEVRHSADIVLV